MKSNEDIVKDVLARRNAYFTMRRKRRAALTAAAGVCLVLLLGAAVWTALNAPSAAPPDDKAVLPANEPREVSVNEPRETQESVAPGEPRETQESVAPDEPELQATTAHSYEYLTAQQMLDRSDIVFFGRYTGVERTLTPSAEYVKQYYRPSVFTDYGFEVEGVLKGERKDRVTVTLPIGRIGDMEVGLAGAPCFQQGKSYLIFALRGTDRVDGDVEFYHVLSNYCFEIDGNGAADLEMLMPEDAAQIKAAYDEAKNG